MPCWDKAHQKSKETEETRQGSVRRNAGQKRAGEEDRGGEKTRQKKRITRSSTAKLMSRPLAARLQSIFVKARRQREEEEEEEENSEEESRGGLRRFATFFRQMAVQVSFTSP